MKTNGKITLKSLLWTGVFLPILVGLAHCRLEDKGPKAEVYPQSGSKDVPVNAVIQVQFPKELGLKDAQMQKGLFSIRECQKNNFSYLTPPEAKTQTTTTTDDPNKKTEDGKTPAKTEDKKENTSADGQTKYGAEVKFFHTHNADKTGRIFNYLVIDPENRTTPLKANMTYCVLARKIKNANGEIIGPDESSFTTEETESFRFETRISPAFFGNRLAPSKNEDQKWTEQDYLLVNFNNQAVNPYLLQSKIKICQKSTTTTSSPEACKDFGKEVITDVFLLEGLKKNEDSDIITANYNIYAIAPHQTLTNGDVYKFVVYTDLDKGEEVNFGESHKEISVDDDNTLSWKETYKQIMDGNNQSVFSEIAKLFFIRSGS